MADKRLLNNTELALFFHIMRPITIAKAREALDAVQQHIEAQAERIAELNAEMDAIRYAAHMPDDYKHGLPSWINQHLYGELVMLRDADGGPISRSEDIQEIRRLRLALKEARGKTSARDKLE